MSVELGELEKFLAAQRPGLIEDQAALVDLLAAVWDQLDGSYDEAMESWKLDRMEHARWEPPRIAFDIERHGAMAAATRGGTDLDGGPGRWLCSHHSGAPPSARAHGAPSQGRASGGRACPTNR